MQGWQLPQSQNEAEAPHGREDIPKKMNGAKLVGWWKHTHNLLVLTLILGFK